MTHRFDKKLTILPCHFDLFLLAFIQTMNPKFISFLILTFLFWVLSYFKIQANEFYNVRGRESQISTIKTILEGESDFKFSNPARMQGMRGFGPQWSGDAHLLWDGKIGNSTTIEFHVWESSLYEVGFQFTKAPDYGVFEVRLNDEIVFDKVDLYGPRVALSNIWNIDHINLNEGLNKITFTLIGSHPSANKYRENSYLIGFDFLKLKNLNPKKDLKKANQKTNLDETTTTNLTQLNTKELKGYLSRYCYDCHNDKKSKGDVNLERYKNLSSFNKDLESAGLILDVLSNYEMPPEDESQPSELIRQKLMTTFQSLIDKSIHKNPRLAKVTMRRMNRYEYNNAVRDLLKLKGDIYPLPEKPIRSGKDYFNPKSGHYPSSIVVGNRPLGKFQIEQQILDSVFPFAIDLQAEFGFNNQGDLLSFSPILLENFLNLSRSILNSSQFNNYCQIYNELFETNIDKPLKSYDTVRGIVKTRLKPFLEKAFREHPSNKIIERYTDFFMKQFHGSNDFSESMKKTISAILSSPKFLFINLGIPKNKVEPLSAYELATRLSFFLWSSIPDKILIEKARSGKLLNPKVLKNEIKRMLESKHSQSLSQNFARQWLRLDKLIAASPDFDRFEIYYSRIGCEQWKFGLQMMMEPLLLFESIMVEDRSIMQLIDSDYTYRSDELDSWYYDKIPFNNKKNAGRFNTFTQSFKRRPIKSKRDGGVMTSAAVLTMTSDTLRTNPILRGAWMASVIFNNPPPPPPDAIPELEADDDKIESEGLTLRQKLIAHQSNESCRSCHAKIDPLGFALENFDPVGRWRDNYRSGLPIDSSGVYNNFEFNGIVELKNQARVVGTRQVLLLPSICNSVSIIKESTSSSSRVHFFADSETTPSSNYFSYKTLIYVIVTFKESF